MEHDFFGQHDKGCGSAASRLPDELMVLRDNKQLVIIENFNPIPGKKLVWYQNESLKRLGVNLRL